MWIMCPVECEAIEGEGKGTENCNTFSSLRSSIKNKKMNLALIHSTLVQFNGTMAIWIWSDWGEEKGVENYITMNSLPSSIRIRKETWLLLTLHWYNSTGRFYWMHCYNNNKDNNNNINRKERNCSDTFVIEMKEDNGSICSQNALLVYLCD